MNSYLHCERDYVNARARLQRLRDLKFFTGWVEVLSFPSLTILGHNCASLQTGDDLLCELYGDQSRCEFYATLDVTEKLIEGIPADPLADMGETFQLQFTIRSDYKYTESQEDRRKQIMDLIGSLEFNNQSYRALVADISSRGAGLITDGPVPVGQLVVFTANIDDRLISLAGEVRYCRKDRRREDRYRVGLLFRNAERFSMAVWRRLYDAA